MKILAGVVEGLQAGVIIGNDLFIQNPKLKDTLSVCDNSSKACPEAQNPESETSASDDGGERGTDQTLDHDHDTPDPMI